MKKTLLTLFTAIIAIAAGAQTTCNPTFTASSNPVNNALLQATFTNTTVYTTAPNTNVSFSYDFTDGSPLLYSNATTVNHTFPAPGSYLVFLNMSVYDSMTAAFVCADSFTQMVTVAYQPCGTQISETHTGNVFNFTATNPANPALITYAWNFGDGSTSTLQNPVHTYTTSGTYNVTLVTTGGGCTYTNHLTVTTGGSTGGGIICSQLNAAFTSTISGNFVNFTNNSTLINTPGVGTTYEWVFGDGTAVSHLFAPNHSYASSGVYHVTLNVHWIDSNTNTICTDTFSQVITIGGITPGYHIEGHIFWDSLNNFGQQLNFQVWLIVNDTAANTLTAVDSLFTSGNSIASYAFNNPQAGHYLVKAAVLNQPPAAAGYIPTYHDSAAYWSNAQLIGYTNQSNSTGNNIWMHQGIVTSGPGFIGGNISAGANKGTGAGIPHILVFLRDGSNNKLVQTAMTDGNGDYSFTNIPAGTYNVYPEQINYGTIPSSNFIVYSTQPTVTGIDFFRNSTEFVPVALSINEIADNKIFNFAPNPARNVLTISSPVNLELTIMNATGSKVYESKLKSGTENIDIANLPTGLYIIRANSGKAIQTQKLLIQH